MEWVSLIYSYCWFKCRHLCYEALSNSIRSHYYHHNNGLAHICIAMYFNDSKSLISLCFHFYIPTPILQSLPCLTIQGYNLTYQNCLNWKIPLVTKLPSMYICIILKLQSIKYQSTIQWKHYNAVWVFT